MSIDYQIGIHKFSPSNYNLKNTYQNFYPRNTFSKGIHNNNKKLKLKNTMSNLFSPSNKEKPKNKTLSTPDQSNPISNNNTCYKTNGFSASTKNIFTQVKAIKEKNVRKKIPKNKKSILSMKYIGFKDEYINNINNHNYLKLVKKSNIHKDINKEIFNDINKEKIKNIFIEDKDFSKINNKKKINLKTNDLISIIENKYKKHQKLNSLSCPDIKLTEEKKNIQNNNNKNKTVTKNFEIHNLFFESKKEEEEQLLNYINEMERHAITTFGNAKKNKGLLVGLKNKNVKKKEPNSLNIQTINNNNSNKLKEKTDINNILKNKGYELNANIEMFDPLTFSKNKNLIRDYLQRKQKEKIYLKKLLKNNKIEDLVSDLNKYNNYKKDNENNNEKYIINYNINYNKKDSEKEIENIEKNNEKDNETFNQNDKKENNSLKINQIKREQNISYNLTKTEPKVTTKILDNSNNKNNLLKIIKADSLDKNTLNIKNNNNNKFPKKYLKPSDYINAIAKKILENIQFFKSKDYKKENNEINDKDEELNKDNNILIEIDPDEEELLYGSILLKNDMITNYIKHKGNIAFYVKNKSKSGGKLNRSKDKDVYKYILEKNKNNSHNVEINDYFHNKKILDSRYKEYEKNISKQNRNIKNIDIKKIYTLPEKNRLDLQNEIYDYKYSYDEKLGIKDNYQNNELLYLKENKKERNNSIISENLKDDDNQKNDNLSKNEDEIIQDDIQDNIQENKENISKDIQLKNMYNNLLKEGKKKKNIKKKGNFKNFNEKRKSEKEDFKEKDDIELYDKICGFNINDKWDDLLIINEFKKIDMNEELKLKLLENRRHVYIILNKNPKIKEDYHQLNLCRKRVIFIIKKLIENFKKENLISKGAKNLFTYLPRNLEDRKKLYIYLRTIDLRIKRELEKDSQLELPIPTLSEVEAENENSNINSINFFSLFPFNDEYYYRLRLEDKHRLNRSKLIYDNSYLYNDGKNDNKKINIKKEVYDILNQPNEEIKDEEEENKETEVNVLPRKRGKFSVRKRRFLKKSTIKYALKKIEDEKIEIVKEDENSEDKKLDKRIKKFYEKIQRLKAGEVDSSDYEDELNELMKEQIDKNIYEEDRVKELRIFNFFKNFQTCRKNEMFGKNYLRKKLVYNSPVYFTFYPKMPKIRSSNSINEQ